MASGIREDLQYRNYNAASLSTPSTVQRSFKGAGQKPRFGAATDDPAAHECQRAIPDGTHATAGQSAKTSGICKDICKDALLKLIRSC
eukprot:6174645-Pleurochrysis_carterae.AAC.2